ncbi:hypothetical protein MTO96_036906 [Rhipicephalus appendiculatus]
MKIMVHQRSSRTREALQHGDTGALDLYEVFVNNATSVRAASIPDVHPQLCQTAALRPDPIVVGPSRDQRGWRQGLRRSPLKEHCFNFTVPDGTASVDEIIDGLEDVMGSEGVLFLQHLGASKFTSCG